MLAGRSVEVNAGFLLPHLRAGMHVLDCGCGPGSITLGLAVAVAPGEVVGIDIEPSQIDLARTRAEQQGCSNVRFDVGMSCISLILRQPSMPCSATRS
jgi:ubiquinone/menaquinone biosynthesis C-methylase UbiE